MNKLRGYKLMMRREKGIKTISLYAKNTGEYYLLISYKWANIYLRKKSFEFSCIEEAELVFRKLTKRINSFPISAQSEQKPSVGF
tara:strand:+ start:1479 stop:1733 length:255 start_codon:yes stop_codon:yes gene_type:complete